MAGSEGDTSGLIGLPLGAYEIIHLSALVHLTADQLSRRNERD
jgi:hypothetical protein